ncbi:MAG: hypothetical protein NVS3B12_10680 [Acidimicrobiales bacterium]
MHYAGIVANQAGLRVLKFGYGDISCVPFPKIAERTTAEVVDVARSASKVILIGKSLGTVVMSHLLQTHAGGMPVVAAAWFTPLVGDDGVSGRCAPLSDQRPWSSDPWTRTSCLNGLQHCPRRQR